MTTISQGVLAPGGKKPPLAGIMKTICGGVVMGWLVVLELELELEPEQLIRKMNDATCMSRTIRLIG
jgi:hypothetical protein